MGRTIASRGKPLGKCGQKFVKVVIASQGAGRVCVAPHLVATDDDATRRDWHRNRWMDGWIFSHNSFSPRQVNQSIVQ